MSTVSILALLIAAFLQFWFMVIEMFLWTKPFGLRVFSQTPQQAGASKVLAANQGLYNGFLAAGLMWSLFYPFANVGRHIAFFFLGCMFVAGLYGGFTASRKIIVVQSVPALLALILVLAFR